MRTVASVAALMFLLVQPLHAELIPGSRTNVGGWKIAAYTDKQNRGFTHCTMSSGYRSGIDMYFGVSSDFTWRVGWTHPEWKLSVGTQIPIVYWIDEFSPHSATARVANSSLVVADLPGTREVFDEFRKGYLLRVRARDTTYAFRLTDTYAALTAMIDCVHRYNVASAPPQPPAPPKPPAPAAPPELPRVTDAQRLEATKVVANLMATGSIAGFRILSDGEIKALNADVFMRAAVVWRAEGVLGTLTIVPRNLASSSDQIASGLLADDSRECKGNFASGSMPDDRSPTVKRVFTACVGGVADVNVRYIIMPVPDGSHYVFGTLAVGPMGVTSEAVSKTEGLLRQALYEVMKR